jgi:hypothetical protein
MRIVYLTLAVFVLINVGAACRTPPALPGDCERVAGGLVRCAPDTGSNRG